MMMRGKLHLVAVAAASLMAFMAMQGRAASAQLLWDWGGDDTIGGSGRQVVAFNPRYGAGQIIVSFGDRRLYYISKPGQAISYPIAIPREKSRWEGVTSVSQKRENPSWTPTPTMLAENPRLPRWVPGGHPMNPLGVRALYLGSSAYRIHGTDAPWTIGTAVSKGCIRLYNRDVLDLYPRVNVGARVTVTYQKFTGSAVSSLPGPLPSVSGLFAFGSDKPVKARRRHGARARSKHAAPSASARRSKAADESKSAEKASGKSATAAVIETASSPSASSR